MSEECPGPQDTWAQDAWRQAEVVREFTGEAEC